MSSGVGFILMGVGLNSSTGDVVEHSSFHRVSDGAVQSELLAELRDGNVSSGPLVADGLISNPVAADHAELCARQH